MRVLLPFHSKAEEAQRRVDMLLTGQAVSRKLPESVTPESYQEAPRRTEIITNPTARPKSLHSPKREAQTEWRREGVESGESPSGKRVREFSPSQGSGSPGQAKSPGGGSLASLPSPGSDTSNSRQSSPSKNKPKVPPKPKSPYSADKRQQNKVRHGSGLYKHDHYVEGKGLLRHPSFWLTRC